MKFKKNKDGFTLPEMLVVLFIILLLSAVAFANYRGGERQYALQRAAYKLAQDLRRTQQMAMSAKEFQGVIPLGGYGIEFLTANPDYYILFADINGNGKYEHPGNPTPDKEVERITLEEGVRINEVFTLSPKTELWIAFIPPDPTVRIRDPGDWKPIGGIRLLGANNQIKTIKVNSTGLIEIE